MYTIFSGSMVAIATPMVDSGEIDWDSFASLLDYHIENKTDGIVVAGTTGECATLEKREHCKLIRFAVEYVAGRIPIIAGTGSNSTAEAFELTRFAKEVRADACLLVSPYYNKPTQEGLFLHHQRIAEGVAIPQILYNVPSRTACDMLAGTVIRLSFVPNIVGVKEATGEIQRTKNILKSCQEGFRVFSGDDETACDLMLNGAEGVISVTANVAPRQMRAMCGCAINKSVKQARAIDQRLRPLHQALFLESNPIPTKWALSRMHLIPQGIRLPLTKLSNVYHDTLNRAMEHALVDPQKKQPSSNTGTSIR